MITFENKKLKDLTFIDLFAGIGGFRMALESLGATCVFSSEINPKSAETYEKNFGEKPFGDITIINEQDIPYHDILCAGFPCQAFSASEKKWGSPTPGALFSSKLQELLRLSSQKSSSLRMYSFLWHTMEERLSM